ncbi:type II secretory ATPase GspE/PulE/Tfp pilus assembly ATPase PilB-like protein [Desulfobotulus alkaliphilus]|uniref:Type II secretory ATPase GspE/PulE/Tfp pilus assembly ATPase PilB-like protein n=1 Tax=Desulfobotulus alkaliphilus TaxID=622671 RepID=A0A562REY5_9BACT|nr:GspE/PulE family protein [Desulfobotulus alkaliphilus]TWI66970.1 type II secretory ATPase GspE/PulE/Tfp pilus assembly ATPase PilB-like protein [Desulfobotulus alkaliphilus]
MEPVEKNHDVQNLKSEVEYRTRLQEISNKIYSAARIDEIFIDLKDEITALFACERLTIYYVDGIKRELVSRFKSGEEIGEIRVPISPGSIAGYSVFNQKLVNVGNVYDDAELKKIDPALGFDKSWDKKSGFVTRQVLVVPIIYKSFLLGALQLINRKDGTVFDERDEVYVTELAEVLGIALHNQKRLASSKRVTKFDYLLENHILTQKELNDAVALARNRKENIEKILLDDFKIDKKHIGESLARFYKVSFQPYDDAVPIPTDLLHGLKVGFMRANFWVPVGTENDEPRIAIDNPHDLQRLSEIRALFPDKSPVFSFCFKEDIRRFIDRFTQADHQQGLSMDDILSQLQDAEEEEEESQSALSEESSAVVQLVNKVVLDSFARGASDIHIEPYPGKQNTQIRVRVDGACTLYQTIPYSYRNAIVSRIKIMADLDIAERRKPQDGKIKFKKYGGKDIELRVATVPTQGGLEDVVMRILAAGEPIPLDKMGFSDRNYENFVQTIQQPYGIIFVCGPTGSGKTTTLHSALGFINKPERKIWTAEDPVEITQKGLRQVQVMPKIGFDFAAAMRSFLRADPDVIMVGEMRDKETTQIGIEASLTGHLVFSTLHTNSAPESVTRLLDMGMDPFNFADAILCILAQRLVRTLCKNCKEAYHPTREEYDEIVRDYGEEGEFEEHTGIRYTDSLELRRPKGCDRCNQTGYAGRMGLHELLVGTDTVKRLIQRKAPMEEIRDLAIEEGMRTLKQDGIIKVFGGHTDLLQVRKVCIK